MFAHTFQAITDAPDLLLSPFSDPKIFTVEDSVILVTPPLKQVISTVHS
ncbi:hypothetical protein CHISP_0042 [Chitinispirillum alkaliphilum]|nr:hypothetical protein CHISP_0042 [Chitinispirillum alkaliphilum]